MITVKVKGICEPINPGGRMCYAWTAYDKYGNALAKDATCSERRLTNTNIQAEYEALKAALLWACTKNHLTVHIESNLELIVKQLTGEWACSAPALVSYLDEIQTLIDAQFLAVSFERVSKADNQEVIDLVRYAYSETEAGRSYAEYVY